MREDILRDQLSRETQIAEGRRKELVEQQATINTLIICLTAADALAEAGKKLKEAVGNSDAEFCNMAIREWQAALRQYREVSV